MNNILQLKGQFQKRKAPSGFGPTNLPKGKSVSVDFSNLLDTVLVIAAP